MSDDVGDNQSLRSKERPKVIIIGAGIAGVGAGNYLESHGFHDFIILEATDRIGGRIHTVDLETVNGRKAEMGANWIHGIDRNPIFKLAIENNLLTPQYQGRKLGEKVMFKTECGEPVYTKIVEEVDWIFGMLMAKCEEFYQDHLPTPLENDSVGAFLEREFEAHIQGYSCPKLRRMIFRHRLLGESVISGCDSMWDVSLSEIGSFEELPGVHYVIPPGFQSAVSILCRDIPDSKIRLNHVVTEINWKPSLSGGANAVSGGVKVTCSNGNVFETDSVICTIPLGYLKKFAGRMFNPQLPDFKTEAIDAIAMGTVNKMLLEFDGVVMPDGVRRLELIWDMEGVDTSDLKNNWFKKIGSFDCIEDNVLLGWICGQEAEYMEKLDEETVKNKCIEIIKMFMQTNKLPNVKKFVRSTWHNSTYSKGSYCYIPVGGSAEHIEQLAEPVHNDDDKPVLFFAGEACHSTFYSSSHGALLSGEKEAQRFLDFTANTSL